MSKNTWRAERFRSANVRRSAHQRAAESARKRRRKLQSSVRSAEAETKKALKEVFIANQQRIMAEGAIEAEPNKVTKQNKKKSSTNTIDLFVNIVMVLTLCVIPLLIYVVLHFSASFSSFDSVLGSMLPFAVIDCIALFE